MNIYGRLFLLLLAVAVGAGCASDKPKPMATPDQQDMALQGLDIPMGEITEGLAFAEPRPEDALILKDIHFDFDKSEIKQEDEEILAGISEWLLNHPEAFIQIEGHCDERGTNEYNIALGERRALSVRSYLTALGTNPDRILTISYGEEKPVCSESLENCWAQNRRAHFLVSYGEAENIPGTEEPLTPEEAEVEIEEIPVEEEEVPEPMVEEVIIEEESFSEEIAEERPPEEEIVIEEQPRTRTRSIGRYHY